MSFNEDAMRASEIYEKERQTATEAAQRKQAETKKLDDEQYSKSQVSATRPVLEEWIRRKLHIEPVPLVIFEELKTEVIDRFNGWDLGTDIDEITVTFSWQYADHKYKAAVVKIDHYGRAKICEVKDVRIEIFETHNTTRYCGISDIPSLGQALRQEKANRTAHLTQE